MTFGRSIDTDIKLDRARPDPSLSPVVGAITNRGGRWFLVNTASRTDMAAYVNGANAVSLGPGSAPLPLPSSTVADITVHSIRSYQLGFFIQVPIVPGRWPATASTAAGELGDINLSGRERWLLAALADPRLKASATGDWMVPTNTEIQSRLGLRASETDLIVDAIADKIVPYIGRLNTADATRSITRRHRIVDFAVRSGLITTADLQPMALPR